MSANLDRSSSNLDEEDETASSSGSEDEVSLDATNLTESPQKQRQVSGQNQIWASVTNPQFIQKGALGGHVEYMITFGFSATNQRCIWKRFSDFHTLYKTLGKTNKRIKNYTDFPKKSIQKKGANSDAFNKERCAKLDIFMKLVVSIDPIPPELSEWIRLSVHNPVANNARKASTIDGSAADSLSGSLGSSSDSLSGTRSHDSQTDSTISSPAQLALEAAAREANLKLQREAEDMAAIQQAVRDRKSLSMDENDYVDGREESIDGVMHGGSPTKSGRNRLGSLQEKIASKLGGNSSGGDSSSSSSKKMEPTYNTQQVDAKVNAAVKRVEETHQDAMKLITSDIERLNAEVLNLLNEKEEIDNAKQEVEEELEELKDKSDYEYCLMNSLALRVQYQVAISRLKIRIAAWERDGRDQHIRFLVEVKSDLPGYTAVPRPPPGMPPPPASAAICGPGPKMTSSMMDAQNRQSLSSPILPPSPNKVNNNPNQLRRTASSGNAQNRNSVAGRNQLLRGNGGSAAPGGGGGGISMNTGPGINTLVRHRYSAFVELKQCLGVDFPLPAKTYFSLSRTELEERAASLESFLQDLVNKFSVDRVPALMQFLGIPPYPEDLVEAALNLKEADLVDHYPNMDAVLDAVADNQVQLQQLQQQRLHRQQQQERDGGGGRKGVKDIKKQDSFRRSSATTATTSSTTGDAATSSIQNSLARGGSSKENLVEVESDESDEERDDSVAVL